MIARTCCKFITEGRPHVGLLGEHSKTKNVKARFKSFAKIYCGLWGWRVWTENQRGKVLFDTDKEDWIHPEVKQVRKTKEPALLIGRLKSKQGIAELEKRLKGLL